MFCCGFRVVQKNLVFVVGLSQRLAEPEVLRKHEYFGKFGKIHKVVINQSTSYAGAQVSKVCEQAWGRVAFLFYAWFMCQAENQSNNDALLTF